MSPDKAAPTGYTLFVKMQLKHFNRRQKQTSFVEIGALRVNSLMI